MTTAPAREADLPPFSNQSGRCPRCGGRGPIRVHFDRDCAQAQGDHFHRLCSCGFEWVESCRERAGAPPGSVLNPYVATPVDE
jgi:hypothetical protein